MSNSASKKVAPKNATNSSLVGTVSIFKSTYDWLRQWKQIWFFIALLLFVVLWYQFLGFYPFGGQNTTSTLPTENVRFRLSDGGVVEIFCLEGQVFKNRLVQNDILECKANLHEVNTSKVTTLIVHVFTKYYSEDSKAYGFDMPEGEYSKHLTFYEVTLNVDDFDDEENTFFIKVPPVEKFSITLEIPGYYMSISETPWYTSTKLQDYIQETLPNLQILALLVGIFGTVNYARQLWQNKS